MLKPFRVSYFEEAGDKTKLYFYCEAKDSDDADEQTERAYPGCIVDITTELDPDEDAVEIETAFEAAAV